MTRKWRLVFYYIDRKSKRVEYITGCETKLMTKVKAIKLAKKAAKENHCAGWSIE